MTARVAQLVAVRLEGTPQSPERAAFMGALSEHEDLIADAAACGYSATRVEKLRMSRRVVVAAYDRATLQVETRQEGTAPEQAAHGCATPSAVPATVRATR